MRDGAICLRLLSLSLLLILGKSTVAQETLSIKNSSATYDVVVTVNTCDAERKRYDPGVCSGPGRISVYRKGSATRFQILRLKNIDLDKDQTEYNLEIKRILFMCRKGPLGERGNRTFEICVVNADGTDLRRLTNTGRYLIPQWSPDGRQIVFHRAVGGVGRFQLFLINADGTGEKQLTNPPGMNGFPNWGEVRTRSTAKKRT